MTAWPERMPEEAARIGRDGRRVVLIGVDGSTTSLRAATYAFGLARREDCRLVIAYVVPAGSWLWALPGAGGVLQRCVDEATELVRGEIGRVTESGNVPVSFVSRVGVPSRILSELADELHADLVVVGASQQYHRWTGGSVATGLVRSARWPVVVIP